MIIEVLAKHNYVKLTTKEAKQSRAKYQHKNAHDMGERYALTIDISGNEWTHYDDRGDESGTGAGSESLDGYLTNFHANDEDDEEGWDEDDEDGETEEE